MSRDYKFKSVEDLVFSDDFMFGAVMREPEICKGVLERLLKIKIEHIESPELQKQITPYYAQKGVRLDVYVADCDKVFDVECQTYKIDDIGYRTRYYQSMIDIDTLLKGNSYSDLKESYILFICLNDPFEKKLPVYTFERVCKENKDVSLNDKTHHIIFNASAWETEQDRELKEFLSFVKNNEAHSDFTKEVAKMVQTKKFENTFINEYLAWNLHDQDVEKRAKREGRLAGIAEGRKEGRLAGIAEGKISAYTDLIRDGLISVKDASKKLGIAEEDLKAYL